MDSSTDRPVALITGASSGIGFALTRKLLQTHLVFAVSRTHGRLTEISSPHLIYLQCDLAGNLARTQLISQIKARTPKLDLLINNAATQTEFECNQLDWPSYRRELGLNLAAPMHLTLELTAILTKSPDPVVINMGSVLGFCNRKVSPIYSITKAGIHRFSTTLKADNTLFRTIEFIPPMIATPMTLQRGYTGLMTADEFVEIVLKNLHSQGSIYIGKARLARVLNYLCPKLLTMIINREPS